MKLVAVHYGIRCIQPCCAGCCMCHHFATPLSAHVTTLPTRVQSCPHPQKTHPKTRASGTSEPSAAATWPLSGSSSCTHAGRRPHDSQHCLLVWKCLCPETNEMEAPMCAHRLHDWDHECQRTSLRPYLRCWLAMVRCRLICSGFCCLRLVNDQGTEESR